MIIIFSCIFNYILGKIDPAIATIKEDLAKSNLRAQSYGWALVVGGFGDSLADFVESNRMPTGIIPRPNLILAILRTERRKVGGLGVGGASYFFTIFKIIF